MSDAGSDKYREMKASQKQIGGEHYNRYIISPSMFIHSNDIPWIEANVIKYVVRHREKGGKEDILKAMHYLELLLEWEYQTEPRFGNGVK